MTAIYHLGNMPTKYWTSSLMYRLSDQGGQKYYFHRRLLKKENTIHSHIPIQKENIMHSHSFKAM